MALVDLTNVNPWAQINESTARANEQNQRTWAQLQNTLDKAAARRSATRERNQALRDREYALANQETSQLVQASTNNKFTDMQLQQLGQQFKSEYYDAVKAYEQSDKGDEARQAFEEAKQRSLGSARVISGSLDKLTAQMETFRQAASTGEISDATSPAVREFMADLQDPEVAMEQYQIVPDENGQLRYQGVTSGGQEVNFLLDDVANGENAFAPVPKADMPKVITEITKDLSNIRKQVKEDWGVREVTDWEAMGPQLESRFDSVLADPTNFKSIAAELGFGYEEFAAAEAGEPVTAISADGTEYELNSLDSLKDAVKQELMDQVEATTPHDEKILLDTRATEVDKFQTEQALDKQKVLDNQIANAAKELDVDYFTNNIVGKVKGVDRVVEKDGKIVFVTGFGKNQKVNQVFDPNKLGDLQRLSEYMGGSRDTSQLVQRANQFKSQLN